MYILSLDTTAKTATAAICEIKNDEVFPLCDARLNSTLTHSESILPMIDFCLKNAGVSIENVDIIAVSEGPGSFTGVRIGVSTVKGLAFGSYSLKCVGVSSLEALAYNVDDSPKGAVICACMDARRNQFYNALFSVSGNGTIKRLCSDRAISESDLFEELLKKYSGKRIVLVGDGANLAYNLFSQHEKFSDLKVSVARCDRVLQDAASVARCAYKNIGCAEPAERLNPVYLRLSQAERERNERMAKNEL